MFTPPDGQSPQMQMYLFTSSTGNLATDPIAGRERGRRRDRRLPRVRARALEPPDHVRERLGRARLLPVRRHGRGLERLVRDGLPRRRGLRPEHGRRRRRHARPLPRATTGRHCARRASTARSRARRPRAPAGTTPAARAATPSATWAASGRAGPRCTPTARSGRRRSGTSARRSASATRASSSPRRWGSRPRNPSFLDMRNAILQANQVGVLDGRADREATIWQVFAGRGMGYFAGDRGRRRHRRRSRASRSRPTPATASARSRAWSRTPTPGKPVAGVQVRLRRPRPPRHDRRARRSTSIDERARRERIRRWSPPRPGTTATWATNWTWSPTRREPPTSRSARLGRFAGGGSVDAFTGPNFAGVRLRAGQAIDQSAGHGLVDGAGRTSPPAGARWMA